MAHAHNEHHSEVQIQAPDKAKIKKIWMTALILGAITAVEFVAAFTIQKGVPLTSLFVILTFVKTFYIVGEFMHLKYEVKALIWSIVIPISFICWLVGAMLTEGNAIYELRTWVGTWI